MELGRHRLRLAGVAVLAALALAAAGCTSSSTPTSSSGKPVKGGTATVFELSGEQPNWIFPMTTLAYFSTYDNQDFQYLMYRPLYVFGGNNDSVTVNYPLSPAKAPVYSGGGKTVVINLKGWKWSNGETVDADDVLFWLHMMSAEFANWAASVPGGIPQNITSMSVTGPLQLTLHLNKAYSSLWYTYNELSQLTPMPNAWDVTKLGAKPGSGGCLTDSAADHWAKCKAVYNFLTAQAKDTSTYASSPIWSVVDGPWKLKTFNTDGSDAFVPNPKYSGSPKAKIAEVKYVPYTSDTTEYTGVKSGQVDVGTVPSQDLPQKPVSQLLPSTNPVAAEGYKLQPSYTWSFLYNLINWNNPTYGPVFKQLYFRQALEYLADQTGMAKTIYRGYGYPQTGAVPTEPTNPWVPSSQKGAGPYPFSVTKAKALLTSHGWSEVGGVMTCTDPSKCGAGVKKGTALKLTFNFPAGVAVFTQQADIYKSDAAKAGIDLSVAAQAPNTIVGEAVPSNHTWEIVFYGWAYTAGTYEPTGDELFASGAGSNGGSYSDPTMDKLIDQTNTQSSMSVFHNYANYAAEQLPVIYMPNEYTIYAVSSKLHGVTFSPLTTFLPEYWYFTKS
jgi:peptide/nickel transport system substrate-binding protein